MFLTEILLCLPHSAWAGGNQAEWADHLGSTGENNLYCLLLPLQIAQFFFNVCYNLNVLFVLGEACNFPMWMTKLSAWYNLSFIVLFADFYYKSYARGGGRKPKNA